MSDFKEYSITIESLANSGNGVGRIDNKVVFVPYTAPGDQIKVKITDDKKTFFLGEVVDFIELSPSRTEPPCQYFGECGGCQWQHLPYESQLEWKQKHLMEVFQRVGKIQDPPIKNIVGSPKTLHYRNRIQLGYDKSGFYYKQRGSHSKVYVDQCLVADKEINENWLNSERQARKLKLKGKVELSWNQQELQIVQVKDDSTTELGFRQVNDLVRDLLIEKIISVARNNSYEKIYDLYCGRGYWTRLIAQENPEAHIWGIDSQRQNIKYAQKLQNENYLPNLRFTKNKVEALLEQLELGDSLCIVDPPRAGLHENLVKLLIKNPPKHLIYISCHPATQARDLAKLISASYQLEEVQAFDMFPQTPHLESWTLLRGRSQ